MIDEALYEQAIERERRRARRDRLLLGVFVIAVMVLPSYGLMALLSVARPLRWPLAILGAVGVVLVVSLGVRIFGSLGAGTAMTFLASGRASDGAPPFSHAEALAAAGKLEEASTAFEAVRAVHGDTAGSLRAEAIVYLAPGGDPSRAKELLQRLRRATDVTRSDELFATHRLIDLYLGPLDERDRAISELRRLAERFPGTPDAQGALTALATLRDEPSSGFPA